MTEPLFFKPSTGLTVREIAALTDAQVRPGANLDRRITNVAPLDLASPDDLTFIDSAKYADELRSTHAGACFLTEQFEDRAPAYVAGLRVREPYRAFVMAAKALFPESLRPSTLFETVGVAPGAIVHPTARLESSVIIDPGVVIGPRAEIGSGTAIAAGAIIGPDVRIGRDCAVGPDVTIVHSLVGDRVLIYSGCRIGQDGYGYLAGPKGHEKIPQLGRVIIQDDVEIGANTTIDRGSFRDTMIGEGSKIDNLVQIGHNVIVGRHCIIVAQAGISGSVTIGDYAMLGGKAGIADHIHIGERALVAAGSRVLSNIPAAARWGGYPARPWREFLRVVAMTRRLAVHGQKSKITDEDQGEEK